jgi:type IV pilus assembly protein PilC
MVIHLVRVGEQTGTLDRVLDRASETLERRRLLKTQLLTALTYPIIVLIAAVGVATFMVLYVIPKIRVFLNSLGRKLPPLTQALVDISDFIQNYVLYFGVGAILLLVGFVFLYRWPPSRLTIDRVALRLPLLGHLLTLSSTAQFAHALSVMLRSGVTLVESLRTMELLQGNKYLAQRVAESRGAVLGGGSLGGTLLAQRTFMPMLAQMVTVGEQSGTLDDVLEDVAKFYEGQLQSTIKLFSSIIEPVIIAVVGGVVGFVYIAFFVALYSTTGPR